MEQVSLELGGEEVGASQFATAVSDFVSVITAVSRNVSGSSSAVQWMVRLRPGSACVDFIPRQNSSLPPMLTDIGDVVERGLVALEKGQALPPGFPDPAIQRVRDIASLLERRQEPVEHIQVRRGGRVHVITPKTAANIDAWEGVEYRDWGTMEGRLDILRGRYGLDFRLYDRLTGRAVLCRFIEELAEDVQQAWRQRVSASGLIRRRANGDPISMNVDEFTVLPDEDDLPTVQGVRGILKEVG